MWKDNKDVPLQNWENIRAQQRQNSDVFGREEPNPWAPPPHTVPVTRLYSGVYPPPGIPPHQPFVHSNAQSSFTGNMALPRYPSWSSIQSAPAHGNHAMFPPVASGVMGHPRGIPQYPGGEYYYATPVGDQPGVTQSYQPEAAPPQAGTKLPGFVVALNVVSMVIVLLHVPAAMLYSKMLGDYSLVLGFAPLGAVFSLVAVYAPACGTTPGLEAIAKRIRRLATAAAVMDLLAAIFVPLALENERQKFFRKEATKLARARKVPFEGGAGIVIALVAFLHLVLCLAVRMRSVLLAARHHHEVRSAPSHGSFSDELRLMNTAPPL